MNMSDDVLRKLAVVLYTNGKLDAYQNAFQVVRETLDPEDNRVGDMVGKLLEQMIRDEVQITYQTCDLLDTISPQVAQELRNRTQGLEKDLPEPVSSDFAATMEVERELRQIRREIISTIKGISEFTGHLRLAT